MPEAEDVLLEAAHHVSLRARALWERRAAPAGDGTEAGAREGAEAAGRRRLERWMEALLGPERALRVVPLDPPPAPGLLHGALARRLRRGGPFAAARAAAPGTDGARLLVPRAWLAAPPDAASGRHALLAALQLGMRAAEGALAEAGRDDAERELAWQRRAARLDAELARALPGLRPALRVARAQALRTRPRVEALRGEAERAVERAVRALLRAEPGRGRERAGARVEAAAAEAAEALAALPAAARRAFRGAAPVPHWGTPRTPAAPTSALEAGGGGPDAPPPGGRPPARRLPRRVERRALPEEEEPERPGPFVLPFSDPHLAVEEPRGLARPPDRGEEEDLDALASELGRQEALPVVRARSPAREVLETGEEAEARGAPGPQASEAPAEGEARAFLYPEWDHRVAGYRPRACRVLEAPLPAASEAGHAFAERTRRERRALLLALRRRFEALRPRRERLRRQLEGDDVDPAGWVEEWASRRAGAPAPGRLYTRERRARREAAVALLLDASGSTDGPVSGAQRTIDVAKEAALCFAEALAALGDRHAVYAFSGRGPGDVRVRRAKGLAEPAGPAVGARIGALEPDAMTRLGAPLRHATAALARERARVRLLLLLSDGRPYDEDAYGGRYGVEDVRQAVAEARLEDVRVFCVTIDREAPRYAPRLFGPGGYTVIRHAAELPRRLPELYRRLTEGAS